MTDPVSVCFTAFPPPPEFHPAKVCREQGAGAASPASAVTRDPDPARDLSGGGSRCPPSAGKASSQAERREGGGEGPIVSETGAGADINVIGGKRLLGFCSSEKYISLK